MAERDNSDGGFVGLLRGIGDLLHHAANMSSDQRRPEGKRPVVESHMSVRNVDGEEIGADFFGLRDFVAAVRDPKGHAAEENGDTAPPPDRREPLIDIFATTETISAIVELPGADVATLTVRVEHDMLTIAASGCGIEYTAEALLPGPVVETTQEQSFRNGVLEVKWRRR
jgi:HSP20 family molecular chaperone IbpA